LLCIVKPDEGNKLGPEDEEDVEVVALESLLIANVGSI
jgi:hypothetical protein